MSEKQVGADPIWSCDDPAIKREYQAAKDEADEWQRRYVRADSEAERLQFERDEWKKRALSDEVTDEKPVQRIPWENLAARYRTDLDAANKRIEELEEQHERWRKGLVPNDWLERAIVAEAERDRLRKAIERHRERAVSDFPRAGGLSHDRILYAALDSLTEGNRD